MPNGSGSIRDSHRQNPREVDRPVTIARAAMACGGSSAPGRPGGTCRSVRARGAPSPVASPAASARASCSGSDGPCRRRPMPPVSLIGRSRLSLAPSCAPRHTAGAQKGSRTLRASAVKRRCLRRRRPGCHQSGRGDLRSEPITRLCQLQRGHS